MNSKRLNRRQFLEHSAVAAGALALVPSTFAAAVTNSVRKTATDQVTLGATGIKLSRLGMGTGSNNGFVQVADGREAFNRLIKYAYDQGITYFDTAETYQTFTWIAGAIKSLPREKLFIQSKIEARDNDFLSVIDHHRKVFNTDYVDSMLIHCQTSPDWTDQLRRMMDDFSAAREKKWIRAKGVSCHTLPALRAAVETDWTEVHLVRVNPQGRFIDGSVQQPWNAGGLDVAPVVAELKNMRAKNRGIIGMKICGNGSFVDAADREKSIRFAMSRPELDAVVIGFKTTDEIDEAIKRINSALTEAS
jgi:predicted aldo/keto reductase-like oxidoreductase